MISSTEALGDFTRGGQRHDETIKANNIFCQKMTGAIIILYLKSKLIWSKMI